MEISLAKKDIKEAIRRKGKFSHNVVSSVLRAVAAAHGNNAANVLVDEFDLNKIYGIEKVA